MGRLEEGVTQRPALLHSGYFDREGSPCLSLSIVGISNENPPQDFEAVIDTGFTEFMQLPARAKKDLGLRPLGTRTIHYSDNMAEPMLAALAHVTFGGRTETGVVLLTDQSSEVLVGMDFLRQFSLALVLSKLVGVVLTDESLVARAIESGM